MKILKSGTKRFTKGEIEWRKNQEEDEILETHEEKYIEKKI